MPVALSILTKLFNRSSEFALLRSRTYAICHLVLPWFCIFFINLPYMATRCLPPSIPNRAKSSTVNPSPQVDKQLQKIKSELRKIGIGGTVTLFMKTATSFTVHLATRRRFASNCRGGPPSDFTVKLADIRKVRQGLGSKRIHRQTRDTFAYDKDSRHYHRYCCYCNSRDPCCNCKGLNA